MAPPPSSGSSNDTSERQRHDLASSVADAELDGVARRLEDAGAPVEWDDRHPGIRRFFTADPFGNRIELLSAGAAPGEDAERPER